MLTECLFCVAHWGYTHNRAWLRPSNIWQPSEGNGHINKKMHYRMLHRRCAQYPCLSSEWEIRDGFWGEGRNFPNRQGNGKSRGMICLNTKLHEIDKALQEILNESVWLDHNVSRVKSTRCWRGPRFGKCQVHQQGVWALKSLLRGRIAAVKHWEQHDYWGCSQFHHFSLKASNHLSIHIEIWTK